MVTFPDTVRTTKTPMMYDTFLGVDFAKTPATTAQQYSPNAVNLIRDEVGKVRRRMGYYELWGYSDEVFGIHKLNDDYIVHAGTKLYKEHWNGSEWERTEIYASMAEHKSVSQQIESKLYILDGTTYLCYDGTTCAPPEGYIPTIIIAGTSTGGGTPYEDVNILSTWWKQRFTGEDGTATYQLAFDDLDDNDVIVQRSKLSNGTVVWETLTEGTHYTVDKALGQITFTDGNRSNAPIVGQEDRLIVTASKARSRDKINKCDIMTLYGYNGQENQLFVAGNPDYKNRDFWSEINDPTYFGDLSYSILGQDNSAIMGYSKISGKLATHKDKYSGDVYLRGSDIVEEDGLLRVYFPVTDVLTGSGAISKYSFQNFGEPLYLTKYGIRTIAIRDLTSKEYEQDRGDRVNKRLLEEDGLENAVSCIYKDFYLLGVNGNVYVLDRLQRQYEPNAGLSEFQYSGFFWDNIPATCFFSDDYLYFGTADGKVMRFYTDENVSTSYNDNGDAIIAVWEFPQFVGKLFWSNKTFKHVFLKLKSAVRTGAALDVQVNGVWQLVKEDYSSFGYIDFDDVDFNNFTFSTDQTPKKTQEKIKYKKLDKIAFRIRNDKVNQVFGIDSFGFLYAEKGINRGET